MTAPTSAAPSAASPVHPATLARLPRLALSAVLAVLLAVGGLLLAPAPAEAATIATTRRVQQHLTDLGYPVGVVDGVEGPRTRQGLCAWRRLSERSAHRGPLSTAEVAAVLATARLPKATVGRGVTVDKTCQTVYYRNDGRWRLVLAASTGSGGWLPRVGDYRIQRVKQGWHTSTLYPAAAPNMYSPMYFDGAIALHGAREVPWYPASKGCVRLRPRDADRLFSRLRVGDPVRVIGAWS